jgi:hypothetical protein
VGVGVDVGSVTPPVGVGVLVGVGVDVGSVPPVGVSVLVGVGVDVGGAPPLTFRLTSSIVMPL